MILTRCLLPDPGVGITPPKRNRQAPYLATPHFFNADEKFYKRPILPLLGMLVNLA
jgi:hypothetical protein